MLPALTSLTHLLVRLAPTPQRPGSALDGKSWVYSSRSDAERDTQVVHTTVREYLRAFARIGVSLSWIGYEVFGWGIKSWDISNAISRPTGSLSGVGSTSSGSRGAKLELEDAARRVKGVKVTVTEMGEEESMAVAKTQGMDVFKGVRPTLVLTY